MNWNRTETIALAKLRCALCHGAGIRKSRNDEELGVCPCVLRSIFRACYEKFKECVKEEKHLSKVSLTRAPLGRDYRMNYERLVEDYICDFTLIAKRSLNDDEYKLFRWHFLLGADWQLCSARLGIDRGKFFHAVYFIMQKLGRVFRELKPYPLFPIDEYFGGRIQNQRPAVPPEVMHLLEFTPVFPEDDTVPDDDDRPKPLRPPLRKAA